MKRRAGRLVMLADDRLTRWLYRLTGGRLGARQLGYPILLLHTTGRKTGKTRTHALLYLRDDERYVVCASNYGAPNHPAWYLNLRGDRHALIEAGRTRLDVLAEAAGPEEHERLWQRFLALRPQYANYQAATTRAIPIVVLTPIR